MNKKYLVFDSLKPTVSTRDNEFKENKEFSIFFLKPKKHGAKTLKIRYYGEFCYYFNRM